MNAGTVTGKMVNEGAIVKKGQVLYMLNNLAPMSKMDASKEAYHEAFQNISASSRILNDLKPGIQNAAIKLSQDSFTALVFDIFSYLAGNKGITILTVAHDLDLAKKADRIIEMFDGKTEKQLLFLLPET